MIDGIQNERKRHMGGQGYDQIAVPSTIVKKSSRALIEATGEAGR